MIVLPRQAGNDGDVGEETVLGQVSSEFVSLFLLRFCPDLLCSPTFLLLFRKQTLARLNVGGNKQVRMYIDVFPGPNFVSGDTSSQLLIQKSVGGILVWLESGWM